MQAETSNALVEANFVSVENLFAGEPVFCFCGSSDYIVAVVHNVGGVVAEGNNFGQAGVLLKIIDVGDVVEVDNRAEVQSFAKFFGGRVV